MVISAIRKKDKIQTQSLHNFIIGIFLKWGVDMMLDCVSNSWTAGIPVQPPGQLRAETRAHPDSLCL